MELTPASHSSKTKTAVIAISVLIAVLIVVGAIAIGQKKSTDPAASDGAASTSASPASTTQASSYKDGTYSASGAYLSPGGDEKIDVTMTVKDNTIADSSVNQVPSTHDAELYQKKFKDNFLPLVIGKKLNDISLSHVSGSSLTSGGFNKAVEQIRQHAKQS
jgi:uncharacterized protein with FMN-binding domain